MLDVALIVFLGFMCFRSVKALRREAPILREFNVSRSLLLFVTLIPLGPLVLLATMSLAPFPLPHVAAAACFVPAMVAARAQARALETAGTARVKEAQDAIAEVFGRRWPDWSMSLPLLRWRSGSTRLAPAPNPSMERTSSSQPRLAPAAHLER